MLIAAGRARRSAAGRSCPALTDPVALLAGIGVGICSSVIPYVSDQLAMRRLPRATYALMVSLLPATATVIGVVVLTQIPSATELTGVALVIAGVALHREPAGAVPAKRSIGTSSAVGPRPVLAQEARPGTLSNPLRTSAMRIASSSWPATGMKSGTRSNGRAR